MSLRPLVGFPARLEPPSRRAPIAPSQSLAARQNPYHIGGGWPAGRRTNGNSACFRKSRQDGRLDSAVGGDVGLAAERDHRATQSRGSDKREIRHGLSALLNVHEQINRLLIGLQLLSQLHERLGNPEREDESRGRIIEGLQADLGGIREDLHQATRLVASIDVVAGVKLRSLLAGVASKRVDWTPTSMLAPDFYRQTVESEVGFWRGCRDQLQTTAERCHPTSVSRRGGCNRDSE